MIRPHRVLGTVLLLAVVSCGDGLGQDRLAANWPDWQRIETGDLPAGWQFEEASPAFDAWIADVVVTQLATTDEATTVRFEDGEGGVLTVRLAALPVERFSPVLTRGDDVQVRVILAQGFEGVAKGLTVFDEAGRLLLLYDDGGYGSAFFTDESRAGLGVERSLRGTGSGNDWEPVDVTFRLDGESLVLAERQSGRLGQGGLVVSVVVSQEWTGELVTDADLSPLAYLVFRADGG